jgi:uncharacterized circularly permuted ATP-grasp superfamily protein
MKNIFILLLTILLSCQTPTHRNPAAVGDGDEPGYDEIYDVNGKVREQYQDYMRVYEALTDAEKALYDKQSRRDLSHDNSIHALPRILTEDDNKLMQDGTQQRSRALVAFLKDHLSGEKKYLKDGIIPKAVIERILNRHQEGAWVGNLDFENLNFLYGPDIIRGTDGGFYALEDNTAMVGGFGDTVAARKSLYERIPAYEGLTDSPDPEKFFENMAKEMNKAAEKMDGIAIILTHPKKKQADNEQERIKGLFKKYNVETMVYSGSPTKKIVVKEDGAYLETNENGKKTSKKIGHVVAYLDSQDIDPIDELTKGKNLMVNAERYLKHDWVTDAQKNKLRKIIGTNPVDLEKLEKVLYMEIGELGNLDYKNGLPGLLKLMREKKLTLTNPPGMDFINDKEFYIYVDKLIEYYLKQKPIIKNLPTKSFAKIGRDGVEELDSEAIELVIKNQKKYVIKQVSGRGGSEVYLGFKLSKEEFAKAITLVKKSPKDYIYQKRVNLSTFMDLLGDYRPLSFVTALKTIVSPVPWARVNFLNGDGKSNISGTGFEAVVLIWKKIVRKIKGSKRTCIESIEVFAK